MNKILFLLSFLLVSVTAVVIYGYLDQYVEFPAIAITAPRSESNEIPIYAQFAITQPMTLHTEAKIIQLRLPIKVTAATNDLIQIDLRQQNKLKQRWRIRSRELIGKDMATLPFLTPLTMKGALEISVSASNIPVARKDDALLVYIEPDDNSYPDGNYRIANNQKKGDMSLTLMQHERRFILLRERWSNARNHALVVISLFVTLFILLGSLPYVLSTTFGIREGFRKDQSNYD